MSDTWYYADQGKRAGPLALQDLKEALARTPNARDVLVWRDGFPDWKKAGDVAELSAQAVPPPSAPTGMPGHPPAQASTRPATFRELADLWFSFKGRANRAKYWLVVLVNAAATCVAAVAFLVLSWSPALSAIATLLLIAAVIGGFVSSLSISIRRLHDRNKSGHWMWLFFGLPVVLRGLERASGEDTMVGMVLALAQLGIFIWLIVELGCMRGTVGPNAYGEDPLPPKS